MKLSTRCAIQQVEWPRDLDACVRAFSRGRSLVWLDSGGSNGPARGLSVVACDATDRVVKSLDPQIANRPGRAASRGSFFRLLESRMRATPRSGDSPFAIGPGWFGFLGFELADELERLPAAVAPKTRLAVARFERHDRVIVLDPAKRATSAVIASGASEIRERHRDWIARWNACATRQATVDKRPIARPRVEFDQTRAQYLERIQRAKKYIAAGDIYQVNLSQRLCIRGLDDPLRFFGRLRAANPAEFGALIRWRGGAVASASPELFLRLRGREVRTRPIKGTRPRTGEPARDAQAIADLLASGKDAAELAMIVDLHRNDLGRVCEPGSVRVASAREVETHPTVIHTVADVRGRLRSDRDAIDLIRACFPAGSISGVPKIRAIEIIRELESCSRGVYTGAIGAIGSDGQMTLSVAIRTLQFAGDLAYLHVGGGIVADSDPAEEYAETLAKARGILRAADAEEALAR